MSRFIPVLELHIIFILISGIAMLGMAYLPRLLKDRPLSLPIIYVIAGLILFALPLGIPIPNPMTDETNRITLEIFTEILVIVSLAAVGLTLRRPIGWRSWQPTWRLLAITMPICVIVIGILGHTVLGLSLAAAVLLGGVLAPTDPVLAADVQVEDLDDDGNEVRFSLTSEAGLNDALAFPFIHLAVTLAATSLSTQVVLEWISYDVIYRIAVGLISGFLVGKLISILAFDVTNEAQDSTGQNAGLVIISATFIAYGITEIFHGYGFLATFVAALVGRREELDHDYNKKTHTFIEQTERLLLSVILIAFGGILLSGVLENVTWQMILIAFLFIMVIRPLAGIVAFIGYDVDWKEKLALSFFGIRGMGSLYYLAYAMNREEFADAEIIWGTVAVTIVMSVFIHGISATPIMKYLDFNGSSAAPQENEVGQPDSKQK